jgi:hypothetical protein
VRTDAARTCELLAGLRDVNVLGVDERLRQPDEVCVDLQHPWVHRPIAIPEGSDGQTLLGRDAPQFNAKSPIYPHARASSLTGAGKLK